MRLCKSLFIARFLLFLISPVSLLFCCVLCSLCCCWSFSLRAVGRWITRSGPGAVAGGARRPSSTQSLRRGRGFFGEFEVASTGGTLSVVGALMAARRDELVTFFWAESGTASSLRHVGFSNGVDGHAATCGRRPFFSSSVAFRRLPAGCQPDRPEERKLVHRMDA